VFKDVHNDNRIPEPPEGFYQHDGESTHLSNKQSGVDLKEKVARLWCFLGMMSSLIIPVISCIPAGFGYGLFLRKESQKFSRKGLGYLFLGMAVATTLGVVLYGTAAALDMLAEQVIALCVIVSVSFSIQAKKNTPVQLCCIAVFAAVLLWIVTSMEAHYQGTTLNEAISTITESLDMSSVSLATRSQMSVYMKLLPLLWPTVYLTSGAFYVTFALSAVVAGRRRVIEDTAWEFKSFALPAWTAILVLVAAGVLAVSHFALTDESLSLSIGLNLLMAARIAYFIQGLSLLWWVLEKYEVGGIMSILAVLLGLYLEYSFYVLCVVGLIDALADFRQMNIGLIRSKKRSNSK
jgi:uncharacterized protein YybS (DUF2232 family)